MRLLESLRALEAVLVFYESPQRLVSALQDIASLLPFRKVAVCRELTKLHEEVVRGSAQELYEVFSERENAGSLKGEIVLVIDAPCEQEFISQKQEQEEDAQEIARKLLSEGTLTKKEIVSYLRRELGLSRNSAYDLVHNL